MLQGEEVHPPAPAAVGQGGVQTKHADGGVPATGPAGAHPHPPAPGRHGPPPAPGAPGALRLHREGGLHQRGGGRPERAPADCRRCCRSPGACNPPEVVDAGELDLTAVLVGRDVDKH